MSEKLVNFENKETGFLWYDKAKLALEHATNVDEVHAIRNQAERAQLYARQAKDMPTAAQRK